MHVARPMNLRSLRPILCAPAPRVATVVRTRARGGGPVDNVYGRGSPTWPQRPAPRARFTSPQDCYESVFANRQASLSIQPLTWRVVSSHERHALVTNW